MTPRLDNPSALFPAGFKAMVALEQALAQAIDPELLELVKLRASQINGCAFCIYMHTADLRKRGVFWLDLRGKSRSATGSPLTEELAGFLGRYGIRLPRD